MKSKKRRHFTKEQQEQKRKARLLTFSPVWLSALHGGYYSYMEIIDEMQERLRIKAYPGKYLPKALRES